MHADITAAGASLIAVSPQLAEHSREVAERHKLGFDVLSDQGNRVASQYGLVYTVSPELRQVYGKFNIDLAKVNGDDSWTLPMPARFVIDTAGIIRAAEANPDYRHRPEPEDAVAAVRALRR